MTAVIENEDNRPQEQTRYHSENLPCREKKKWQERLIRGKNTGNLQRTHEFQEFRYAIAAVL
jgi:hypothetical protein